METTCHWCFLWSLLLQLTRDFGREGSCLLHSLYPHAEVIHQKHAGDLVEFRIPGPVCIKQNTLLSIRTSPSKNPVLFPLIWHILWLCIYNCASACCLYLMRAESTLCCLSLYLQCMMVSGQQLFIEWMNEQMNTSQAGIVAPFLASEFWNHFSLQN